MTRASRLFTGLLLLLISGAALAVLAPHTLGRAVLDLTGTETRGTVTGKHRDFYWNRLRGNLTSRRVLVRFRTADNRLLTGDYSVSRETYETAARGKVLDVVYWAPVPRLSAIEPTPWSSPAFAGLFALTLVLLWLFAMAVVRSFAPPRRRRRRRGRSAFDH